MDVGGQRHAPAALLPAKRPGTHSTHAAGWAPRQEWTGAENLAPTGIRSPDRPARSESLYRLRYPGPLCVLCGSQKIFLHNFNVTGFDNRNSVYCAIRTASIKIMYTDVSFQ
jgi:hypothetical protein